MADRPTLVDNNTWNNTQIAERPCLLRFRVLLILSDGRKSYGVVRRGGIPNLESVRCRLHFGHLWWSSRVFWVSLFSFALVQSVLVVFNEETWRIEINGVSVSDEECCYVTPLQPPSPPISHRGMLLDVLYLAGRECERNKSDRNINKGTLADIYSDDINSMIF
jgi:hypothetical protein